VEAELLRVLIDCTEGLLLELDAETRYVNVWTDRDELLARPREELYGRTIEQALGPEVGAPFAAVVRRVFESGQPEKLEYPLQVSQGLRWFAADVRMTPAVPGRAPSVTLLARDITEQKAAEAALRESEERYRLLFDLSPLPTWLVDEETLRFVAVNDATCEQYGYSRDELLQKSLNDLHFPEDHADFHAVFGAQRAVGVRRSIGGRHRRRDGGAVDVEVHSYTILLGQRRVRFAVIFDITARLHLEEQLRQAQKMEALGRLAGGAAHDFNNLLSIILGWSEFLAASMPEDDERRSEVAEILEAGRRAAALTKQLLTFSRRQVFKPEPLDPSALIRSTVALLERLLGEDIQVTTAFAPEVPRIMADRGQIEQVLINLAMNARDAMPDGGTLTLTTAQAQVTDVGPNPAGNLRPGGYATITVRDTGSGMDARTLSSLFEPFFTTKKQGKGTGLGLATAFGIVSQSGGSIAVDSAPGQGATFTIYLPAIDELLTSAPPPSPTRAPTGLRVTTVLLVEDEDALRRMVCRMLESRGHRVIGAASGEEALALFEREGAGVDLVLTDLVMPGIDGIALASRLQRQPPVKVLFMSGYSEHAAMRKTALTPGVNFLQKPFTAAELDVVLRRLLPDEA
jgi:hypothetical protein